MKHPLPHWPRGLNRLQAASYVGVSAATFDRMIAGGMMPVGKRASENRVVWDLTELDIHFQQLPSVDGGDDVHEWDKL